MGSGGGFAPVKVGEEIDVKIEAVGEKGDGIARKKGFVLFVPNSKEGDEVRIRITKVLRKVGFAEVVGQAQGPIEEDAPPKQSRRQEAYAEEDAPLPEPEPSPEDSDDFGSDLEHDEDAPEEEEGEKDDEESSEPELDVPPPPEDEEEKTE